MKKTKLMGAFAGVLKMFTDRLMSAEQAAIRLITVARGSGLDDASVPDWFAIALSPDPLSPGQPDTKQWQRGWVSLDRYGVESLYLMDGGLILDEDQQPTSVADAASQYVENCQPRAMH